MAKKLKADEVAAAPPADEVVPASDEVAVAPLSTCDWPERISYLDQLGTLIAESTTTAEKGVYEELQVILSEALMKVKAVSHKVADDLTHIAHDIEVLFKE